MQSERQRVRGNIHKREALAQLPGQGLLLQVRPAGLGRVALRVEQVVLGQNVRLAETTVRRHLVMVEQHLLDLRDRGHVAARRQRHEARLDLNGQLAVVLRH